MKEQIVFSLDIGSSKIIAIAGGIANDRVVVYGIGSYYFTTNNSGNDFLCVSNGVVCDLEAVGAKVAQVLNEARINADCSAGSVILNIAGNRVCNLYSSKVLELMGEAITVDTIKNLMLSVKNFQVPANYEILDYEVQEYLLDKENYTVNPVQMAAHHIESHVNFFIASNVQISNIKKVMRYSGFTLSKLLPSGILSAMSVLNHEEKELGCCLLDIGAGTTDIVVYENGFIRYLCSIPVGGENITRDIASVLKISRNLAEDIKLNHGGCSYVSGQNKVNEGITMTDHRGINTTISRKLLIDVIAERLKDIFEVVKTSLAKHKLYDIINSGIVVTGGTALLPNIEEFARQYFSTPIRLGVPNYVGDFADLLATPKYATSLGGIYFAKEYMLDEITPKSKNTWRLDLPKIATKVKNIFG